MMDATGCGFTALFRHLEAEVCKIKAYWIVVLVVGFAVSSTAAVTACVSFILLLLVCTQLCRPRLYSPPVQT